MSVRSGVPCWVDLCSPDLAASARFYTGLFGWAAQPCADPDYTDFFAGDAHVAAAGLLTAAEQPVSWTTYVATDDADAVTSRVLRNGGTMLMAPTALTSDARLALFVDPTGAPFGAWQPTSVRTDRVGHGTLTWTELTTRDPQRARSFYRQVFGWTPTEDQTHGMNRHTTWLLDNEPVGGMITMTDDRWRTPARWTVYFAVDDCDAAAARAQHLGGTVSVPPTDIAAGRFALVRDPHGAMFSLLATASGNPPAPHMRW